MVAVRSNGFCLFAILLFTNSVIEIASRSSNFRSDVKLGRRDTGSDSSSSDEVSEGSGGPYCIDTSEYFTVESLGIKMRCDDLKRQNDRIGCTASKIREKCPNSCNSCPNRYETDDDYGSEYLQNSEDSLMYLDDDAFHKPAPAPPAPPAATSPSAPFCVDVSGTFMIKRYGDRISCSNLLTEKYEYGCKWKRMKLKCPRTCKVCNSGTEFNNGGDGINRNNNNNFFVPGNLEDDDDAFGSNPTVTTQCEDILTSFRLLEDDESSSIITCVDLERSQYRLACTWKRIEKKCPVTCGAC